MRLASRWRWLLLECKAIAQMDTIPSEVTLIVILITRSVLTMQGSWMTAPAWRDGWLLYAYVVMGLVHLWAIFAHNRRVRGWCSLGQLGAWVWVVAEPWVATTGVSWSPPMLAVVALWTVLRNSPRHER